MPPKNFALPVAALLAAASFSSSVFATPLITEFMADNDSTLADEDGAFSDWIEIHNPDAMTVDLDGWTLTDSATNLTKWTFPPTTIAPGGFLVVFASGKNKQVPGSELHTNFSLSAGGEYLALVAPGGVTIANEFAPTYPAQDPDRSFGLAFSGIPLVGEGATASYQIPSNGTLGTTWTQTGFTPTGWSSGQTGLGFGLQVSGFTVRDVYSSSAISNLSQADALLAGTGVISETTVVRPTLNFLDTGSGGHFGNNQVFPGGGGDDFVTQGTATIIIPTAGVWTFGINSDDGGRIRVDGTNVVVDDTLHGSQDHLGTITLSAGPHTIDAMFFERGGGAEIEIFAAFGSFGSFDSSMQLVGDTTAGGLQALTTPDGSSGGGVIATNISAPMLGVNPGAYVRIPFTVNDVNALESLSLNMRYNDGFVAYLNGTRVASANASAGTPAWNSTATAARANSADAFIPHIFNLTTNAGLLTNGANNVLSIHGLNITAADNSFLVLPELTGGGLLAGDPFYFDLPTPSGINSAPSSQGKVEDTKFSPDRGFYTSTQLVTITTLTPGAEIRYTTDGSKPTATTGTVYAAPISINTTTVLRAAAFKFGFDPTDVDTHTYLFVDDVIQQPSTAPSGWPTGPVNGQVFSRYGMDTGIINHTNANLGGVASTKEALQSIPTLSISLDQDGLTGAANGIYTHPGNRGLAWEREASIELIHPPGWVDPDGNLKGFQSPCGLRIRGGFSRSTSNPKHSFRVFFRSDYGNGRLNYKLFGDEGANNFDKVDLRGPQNYSWAWGGSGQNSFMRDTWSRDLQGEMGNQYTRGRWYHLYLNGVYWGMTQTDERAEANYGETYFGGTEFDYDVVKSFGDVTDGNSASYQRLYDKWVAGFTTNAAYYEAQGKNIDGTINPAFERLLDAENLIDYMVITYYTGDRDGPGSRYTQPNPNNYFGIYNRVNPDGFKFFEHDSEHSLGTGENNMVTPFTSSSTFAHFNPHTLHEGLADDNLEYRMAFSDRIAELCYNGGLLTDAVGIARVDRRAAQIDRAIIAHSARWGDAGTRNRNDWLNAVQNVRNFITNRVPTMISQLRSVNWYPSIDPPAFSQYGGYISSSTEVFINSGPGTIYYLVNGQDPRQQGGAITAGAQMFQGNTTSETLVAAGAVWKYLDNGSNQGTAWRQPGFDDSSWLAGPAQLGYGNGPVTQIEFGPDGNNKYATSYFRRTFNATSVSGFSTVNLEIQRDDGAVVYLNGTEIARTSMPTGVIDYLTNANVVAGGNDETTFFPFSIPLGLLVNGTNTLAVEVHQANASSSDLSFDLRLTGVKTTTANPLFLTQTGVNTIQSRVLNNGEWSALTSATFVVDAEPASASNLVVSEIHYRPASPSTAEINAGFIERSEFEFVELTNIGSSYIDLANVVFFLGVQFTFDESNPLRILAPGARVLLVNNIAAFEFRYGTGLPVAGVFSGSLSNDGEQITLLDADQSAIQDFIYNDVAPWPSSPDGDGYTLVLISPANNPDPANPFSWRNSSAIGGTPGTSDATNFVAWKAANTIPSDLSDDDKDGIEAILEYVLGGDPDVPSADILPTAGVSAVDVGGLVDDYLVIDIRHRAGADDVSVLAEVSTELGIWEATPVFMQSFANGDGSETLRFRSATPFSGQVRQFIRARAAVE
jgi:hypothetical protein